MHTRKHSLMAMRKFVVFATFFYGVSGGVRIVQMFAFDFARFLRFSSGSSADMLKNATNIWYRYVHI